MVNMDQNNIQNQLKKLLDNTGGRYNILEEQINIELQLEFFELANKLMNKKRDSKEIFADEKKLYDPNTNIEEQKTILAELSISENAKSYRLIEKFINSKNKNLDQWAILALQHSRIELESFLLDEQQIFISSGLGGKGKKLRFFIVCRLNEDTNIKDIQKKTIQTEFEISFKNKNSVIEKISYFNKYFSILALIPIDTSIDELIINAINESNIYGGFINDKYLITNIKILNITEIEKHFKKFKI